MEQPILAGGTNFNIDSVYTKVNLKAFGYDGSNTNAVIKAFKLTIGFENFACDLPEQYLKEKPSQ